MFHSQYISLQVFYILLTNTQQNFTRQINFTAKMYKQDLAIKKLFLKEERNTFDMTKVYLSISGF